MVHPKPRVLLAGRYRVARRLGSEGLAGGGPGARQSAGAHRAGGDAPDGREPDGDAVGSVWQATDTLLGRDVALKVLATGGVGDTPEGERFRAKARAIARLSHPRVANVYDYRETDDCAFIVMELLHGDSLADLLAREGRLRPSRAADIAAQVAQALDAAHRADIVHRRVEPARILLTDHGVKLVDFALGLDEPDAESGTVKPGPYTAPELHGGGSATPAADLYGLGAVLYEMLTGRLPRRHAAPPPGRAAGFAPSTVALPENVPRSLALLCERLLSPDPELRAGPAWAVADALIHAVPVRVSDGPSQPATADEAAAPARGTGSAARGARRSTPARGTVAPGAPGGRRSTPASGTALPGTPPSRTSAPRGLRPPAAATPPAAAPAPGGPPGDAASGNPAGTPPAAQSRRPPRSTPRRSESGPLEPLAAAAPAHRRGAAARLRHALRDQRVRIAGAAGVVVAVAIGAVAIVFSGQNAPAPPVHGAPPASAAPSAPASAPAASQPPGPDELVSELRYEVSAGVSAGMITSGVGGTLDRELASVDDDIRAQDPQQTQADIAVTEQQITRARAQGTMTATESDRLRGDLTRLAASLLPAP